MGHRKDVRAGLAAGGIGIVAALGFGLGFANVQTQRPDQSSMPTTIVCPPNAPCDLPKEIARRYAENRHPVPGPDGKLFGWVSNNTINAEPVTSPSQLGPVLNANGDVIGYYDPQLGVVSKAEVESGSLNLTAAYAAHRPKMTQAEIDQYIDHLRAAGRPEQSITNIRTQLELRAAGQ